MLPRTHDPSYWTLIQELMRLGWYRTGPGPDRAEGKTWGFREGHLIDIDQAADVRWISARNEMTAMRRLLAELGPRPSRDSRHSLRDR